MTDTLWILESPSFGTRWPALDEPVESPIPFIDGGLEFQRVHWRQQAGATGVIGSWNATVYIEVKEGFMALPGPASPDWPFACTWYFGLSIAGHGVTSGGGACLAGPSGPIGPGIYELRFAAVTNLTFGPSDSIVGTLLVRGLWPAPGGMAYVLGGATATPSRLELQGVELPISPGLRGNRTSYP